MSEGDSAYKPFDLAKYDEVEWTTPPSDYRELLKRIRQQAYFEKVVEPEQSSEAMGDDWSEWERLFPPS